MGRPRSGSPGAAGGARAGGGVPPGEEAAAEGDHDGGVRRRHGRAGRGARGHLRPQEEEEPQEGRQGAVVVSSEEGDLGRGGVVLQGTRPELLGSWEDRPPAA
eukprot:4474648-Pyramimonas_sp.AAC.1